MPPRAWQRPAASAAWAPIVGLSVALGVAGPGPARADDVDEMAQRMVELEAQVRELDITLKSEGPNAEAVERRIIDGQVLYELKNYEAASIILLDVVERYPNDRSWPEALFYLADSLYLKRDFLSARRYLEQCASLGPASKHYQDSLERLIELSLYTKDDAKVDDYLAKLGSLGRASTPNVAYIEGKYQFFHQRYELSQARLTAIQPGQPYWFQAQYFLGAIAVAQGRPLDAIQIFDALVKAEPKPDAKPDARLDAKAKAKAKPDANAEVRVEGSKDLPADVAARIVELAHLALGRLYYDQGQIQAADLEYSRIAQGSDLYSDALYESGWVAIKDKQFAKAYRALDLLLTITPDMPQSPEIHLLMSNLQVRQGQYDDATRSFTVTRDEFEGVKKDLDESLRKQGASEAFFRAQIARSMGKFDLASFVPESVGKWIGKQPDMDQVGGLIGDEADLKKSLEESAELIAKLEKAIDGPTRVNIFPELAAARTRAQLTGNRLIDLENKLIQREHDLVVRDPTGDQASRALEEATRARVQIQRDLASAPRAKETVEERSRRARSEYDEMDKRAVELNVLLANLRAEIVAIEKYAHDTHQAEDVQTHESFARQLADVKQQEAELSAEYERIRRDIADSAREVGVDDSQSQAEAGLRKQLDGAQQAEREAMSSMRARLSGPDRSKADQIEAVLGRARAAQAMIDDFNGKIEGLIEQKLGEMRGTIADEKAHLVVYQRSLDGYRGETAEVGGSVTAASFRAIADRLYQIVVRADVGIIDVAWALKQSKTDENSRLVREKKRELKLLDDEFKEVLKE